MSTLMQGFRLAPNAAGKLVIRLQLLIRLEVAVLGWRVHVVGRSYLQNRIGTRGVGFDPDPTKGFDEGCAKPASGAFWWRVSIKPSATFCRAGSRSTKTG